MATESTVRDQPVRVLDINPSAVALITGEQPADPAKVGDASVPYNPGRPNLGVITPPPQARRLDYMFSHNINWTPKLGEGVSFSQLRALSRACDLLRLAIERRKDQVIAFEWGIAPVDRKDDSPATLELCRHVMEFFEEPSSEYYWEEWVRVLLEDLIVLDAMCVVPRYTAGGDLYSLDPIDGATIKKLLDDRGFTPEPPEYAYQQVIKGLPMTPFTRDELLYWSRNPSSDRVYGYSPVEQIIVTINTSLQRAVSTLSYFTEGNMPDALVPVPETWNLDTVRQFQEYWDELLSGQIAQRRRMKFVPLDPSKLRELKPPDLKNEFDEWIARVVCFAMNIPVTSLVRDNNRATGKTVDDEAKDMGLRPLLKFVSRRMNVLIQRLCGLSTVEFRWKKDEDVDPQVQANINATYIDKKVLTPDEVRESIGRSPLTKAQREEAFPAPPPMFGNMPNERAPKAGGGVTGFDAKDPADEDEDRAEAEKLAKHIHLHVNVEAPAIKIPPPTVILNQ